MWLLSIYLNKYIHRIHGDKAFKWMRVAPKQPAIKGFFNQSAGQEDAGLGPPCSSGLEGVTVGGAKRHPSGQEKHPGVTIQITSDDIEPNTEQKLQWLMLYGDLIGDDIQINDSVY